MEEILKVLEWAKAHWYFAAPLALGLGGSIIYYFHKATQKDDKRTIRDIEKEVHELKPNN